MWYILFQEQ